MSSVITHVYNGVIFFYRCDEMAMKNFHMRPLRTSVLSAGQQLTQILVWSTTRYEYTRCEVFISSSSKHT